MLNMSEAEKKPLNREPPVEKLVESFITKKDGYDRNHGPIPHLDASTHKVDVDGCVDHVLSLSVPDLKELPQRTVVCALQCAGNRRHTMRTELKEVSGVDWFDGAVMNCRWKGPRLRDVLLKAGIDLPEQKMKEAHVAFACFQAECQDDTWYGGSIPLDRAMDEEAEVLLALEMNGEVLEPNHGFPVRVVAPGIAGARSVKWLDRITVQLSESTNFYQQHDYKILPPEADTTEAANDFWHRVPAVQEMPVNSIIAVPQSESRIQASYDGTIKVKGYALPSGHDGPIVKVEVSSDNGRNWQEAELTNQEDENKDGVSLKWAWTLWQITMIVEKGKGKKLLSRATDKGDNVQESSPEWNLRGIAYNGYGQAKDIEIV